MESLPKRFRFYATPHGSGTDVRIFSKYVCRGFTRPTGLDVDLLKIQIDFPAQTSTLSPLLNRKSTELAHVRPGESVNETDDETLI